MIRPVLKCRRKSFFMIIVLLWIGYSGTNVVHAHKDQHNYGQYKGEVIDSDTNKSLVFATISLDGTHISTVTNTEGQFLLKVPARTHSDRVIISFLGYWTKVVPLVQ